MSGPAQRPLDDSAVQALLRRRARDDAGPPWLHAEVARRMGDRLAVVKRTPATVIDWWPGAGGGDAVLRAAYPAARLWQVEPTPALQQRARQRAQAPWWTARRWRRPATEVMAAEALPDGGAELLWANMMLHWAADPPALMARWQRALAVDGFLMFSTLGPGTLAELRALYAAAGWPSPMAPLVDMHDLGDMLVAAGFADPVMDQEVLTLSWPDADALLAELRQLGPNADPARFAGLRTPRWRRRLADALAARADAQGRIALSFEVVYGHAFKPLPRARVAAETAVSVADMRAMVRGGGRR